MPIQSASWWVRFAADVAPPVAVLFSWFGVMPRASVQPRLVVDSNRTAGSPLASDPGGFVRLPSGDVVFAARTQDAGREMFVLAPNATMPQIVDVHPGAFGASPHNFVAWRGGVIFTATDPQAGAEPWFYKPGQPPQRIADVAPGLRNGDIGRYVPVGNVTFFVADDQTHGSELWLTDGTAAGTRLVADIRPGTAGAGISAVAPYGNGVAFVADDGVHGFELWVSDGTAAGTRMVLDLYPGPSWGVPGPVTPFELNGRLLFLGDDGQAGAELWSTDGTAAGTSLVADLVPGPVASSPLGFTALSGGRVMFSGGTAALGRELWVSDGTANGTSLVEIVPGSAGSQPMMLTSDGTGRVFCRVLVARNGVSVNDLAVSDGTAAGTRVLGLSGDTQTVISAAGGVAFAATSFGALWRTDGTLVGTRQVAPDRTVVEGFATPLLAVAADLAYFPGTNTQRELFVSDGTAAGTRLFVDLEPRHATLDGNPVPLGELSGRLLFSATTGTTAALFATDASTANVDQLMGLAGPQVVQLARCSDYLLLADMATPSRVVCSDGTVAGTRLLAGVDVESGSTQIENSGTALDATRCVFAASVSSAFDYELWVTDGTAVGTRQLANLHPTGSSSPRQFVRSGARAFFLATTQNGVALHVTDGTPAGTAIVQPAGSTAFRVLGPVDSGVIFVNYTAVDGYRLWHSDGSLAGTYMLDLGPGASTTLTEHSAALDGRLIVTLTASLTWRVYATDGTTSVQLPVALTSSQRAPLVGRAGDRVIVLVPSTATTPHQLFATDGTVAGTSRLSNSLPSGDVLGLFECGTDALACLVRPVGGPIRIFRIVVDASVSVRELGSVEGTFATGTPGPVLANGHLFLRGSDPGTGVELWTVPVGAVAQTQGVACAGEASLRSTAPRLGTALTFTVRGSASAGVLGLGLPQSLPLRFATGTGACVFHLADPLVLVPISASLTLPVPADASLAGGVLEAQALLAPFTFGGAWSNGLRLRLDA